jgi:hypothetical protein
VIGRRIITYFTGMCWQEVNWIEQAQCRFEWLGLEVRGDKPSGLQQGIFLSRVIIIGYSRNALYHG